jgi:hypothetical protein
MRRKDHVFELANHSYAQVTGHRPLIGKSVTSDWEMTQINTVGLRVGQRDEGTVIGRIHWDVRPEIIGAGIETRLATISAAGSGKGSEFVVTLPRHAGASAGS